MDRVMYWSHFYSYRRCPQRYLWEKGWEGLDVGGGLGKPKPKPSKIDSRHHAVMGIAIQATLEWFYNEKIWTFKDKIENIEEVLTERTLKELRKACTECKYIDWQVVSLRDLEAVCLSGVLGYLKTLKKHKLLSSNSESEVSLFGNLDKDTRIGGRVDFVIVRKSLEGHDEVLIMDGKNSIHKDKFLDNDQLLYYALCYYTSEGEIPDRVGWVYFRYPYEKGKEEGVAWVPFNEADLQRLKLEIIETREFMEDLKFSPTPGAQNCKYCAFEEVCEARIAQKKEWNSKRKSNKKPKEVKDFFLKSGTKKGSIRLFGFPKAEKDNE